jgi:outer membrane receptor protein involved in Fe transport
MDNDVPLFSQARCSRGDRKRDRTHVSVSACALLLAGALPLAAAAQEHASGQDREATRLPAVEVIAPSPLPGTGVDRDALPYATQTATAEDIDRSGAQNLIQFLARELAGVNINEVQGSPFQTDLTFRGFRASSVLGAAQGLSIYLDGVRINEPFGDIVSWDMVPEAAIRSLALLPGSNPLFGPNTQGGALAFATKSGLTDPGVTVDLSWGSDARKRADLTWGLRAANGWHAFVAASGFDEDGWRDQSEGRLHNLFAKIGREGEHSAWDVSVLTGRSTLLGNGLLPSTRFVDGERVGGLYQDDRRAIYTAPDLSHNRLEQITAHASHWFDEDTRLAGLVYVRRGERDTVNGDISEDYEEYVEDCENGFDAAGDPLDDDCEFTRDEGAALNNAVFNGTELEQDSHGAGVDFEKQAGAHRITAGLTFDRSDVEYRQVEQLGWLDLASRVVQADPDQPREFFSGVRGDSSGLGVFVTDTWAIAADTHLTGSLRWNRVKISNTLSTAEAGDKPRETFTYHRLNPALGITHRAGGGLTLFAGVAQSNRAPTVIELGCADPEEPCRLPTGLQGDPFLPQVVSRTGEAGLRWRPGDATSLSLTLYRTDNRDDILFLRAPNTQQGYFASFERTRNQGVDLDLSRRFGAVELSFGYSRLDASYQAEGELLSGERTVRVAPGTRLAGLPEHTLKLGLDWQATDALSIGANLQAVSDLVASGNEDGGLVEEEPGSLATDWNTGGYTIVNLRARWRPSEAIEIYAGVENLFDRRYETFGQIGADIVPNGTLLQPHLQARDAATALFVAPGAPRRFLLGMRCRF